MPLASRLLALLAPLALVLVPARLAAQTGVVAGRVSAQADSGAPAPAAGAAVSIAGSALAAATGADGRFVLAGVPAGARVLRVRLLGHRAAERPVVVTAGDTTRVDVVLRPEAQRLAAVRTDAIPTDLEAFRARPNVSTVALGSAAMAGVPRLGEPDVIRVAQLLPGVVARNDFSTGLNVRGGEADQNLILLDGYPIYNPVHLGGLFSTFMDATVGGIELLTGAFPARFGGRLSSVLDVRSAEETRPGVHGVADISVLGASAKLGGLVGGARGAWSLAARRTYADALVDLVSTDQLPYHFRDLHGRVAYALPGGVRIAVTGYTGRDVLDANLAAFDTDETTTRANEGSWAIDWGNDVLGATIAKDVGPRLTIEQRASTSGFSTHLNLGAGSLTTRNSIRDVRLAGSAVLRTAAHDPSAGYEVATHRVRYAAGSEQTGSDRFDLAQRPTAVAGWVGDLWRVSPRLLLEGGLRAEAVSGRRWAALSPRVSAKLFATPELAFTLGSGRVTQWTHSLAADGPIRLFDIWLASDERTPVATAWHWLAGAERWFGAAGSVRVEGFYKRYRRVLEQNPSEDPQIRGDEFFPAEGASYGIDLLARRQTASGVGGWVAYSYGLASRRRGEVRYAPGHDRRHDVNVVATWRRAKYLFGASFALASGTPFTGIVGEIARRVYDPSRDRWGTGDPPLYVEPMGGARNGERFPASHRLDLDASRELRFGRATVAPYVSVVNAYNAPNVFLYVYEYSTARPTRRAISQFPVLPSVGVRVVF